MKVFVLLAPYSEDIVGVYKKKKKAEDACKKLDQEYSAVGNKGFYTIEKWKVQE